jgi:hypothetical protein
MILMPAAKPKTECEQLRELVAQLDRKLDEILARLNNQNMF